MATTTHRPTSAQLRYLRDLATQRGESFAYPKTKAQASAEIRRLKGRNATMTGEDRRLQRDITRRERHQIRDDMVLRTGTAASVHRDEIRGYGSSATWAR